MKWNYLKKLAAQLAFIAVLIAATSACTIGQRFEQFEHASQDEDDEGRRLLRVSAVGRVEDVPIRWVYFHVSDEQGRRAAHVFTMEAELAERLGGADHMLVGGFRFAERKQITKTDTTASSGPAASDKTPPAANRKASGSAPTATR